MTTLPLRVLSLGAGVQSTALLLMSLAGEIPKYDHIIFSDTGWEPTGVYVHLAKLHAHAEAHGQKITVVSAGNIRADHVAPQSAHLFIRKPRRRPELLGKQRTFIPFYVNGTVTKTASALTGGLFDLPAVEWDKNQDGHTYRTCTVTYKIEPVEKHLRKLLGLQSGARWPLDLRIIQSLGISLDEISRMKDSLRPAIRNEYPLIDLRMTRDDCHSWMADHGWSAPRSACIGCPFHRNDEWRRMRDTDQEAWADAIDFDTTFRARQQAGLTAIDGTPYLHDSRVPLCDANIDLPAESQSGLFDGTVFGAECTGFCGT